MTDLHRPSVFVDLPLMNVQQALKRMQVVHVKEGDEIIKQGDLFL